MFGPYPGSLMLFHLGENTAALGAWAGKLSPNPKEQAKNNSGVVSEMLDRYCNVLFDCQTGLQS